MKTTFLVLALVLGALGCSTSSSALRAHSTAAQSFDSLAGVARKAVFDLRAAELDKASEAAKASGATADARTAAIQKAAADFDAKPLVSSVNAFIFAKDAYVRGVLLAASQESPDWSTLKPILNEVVKAYTAMRAALGNPEKLPEVPKYIADLLS